MTPEQLAQLFQPFNRLGQESSTVQGKGIGLVMAKCLIELMDGNIGVASTFEQGSEFWVELNQTAPPLLVVNEETESLQADLQAQAPLPQRKLLYVEDNTANLMLVEDIVSRRPDINLLIAVDGYSGIKLAIENLPDVIHMDINLPGINGIQARETLTVNPATSHIPVVALSANAIPYDIQKGLEAGFFRYLTRPIRIVEFLDTLDLAFKYVDTHAGKNSTHK